MAKNEIVNGETGEVEIAPSQMRAPTAKSIRLAANGSEALDPKPLVSPLSRQPSLKDRIEAMTRNGELAELIRASQNMMNMDDDDFEAFERNFPDEEVPTLSEIRQMRRSYEDDLPEDHHTDLPTGPTGPEETPATPPTPTPNGA